MKEIRFEGIINRHSLHRLLNATDLKYETNGGYDFKPYLVSASLLLVEAIKEGFPNVGGASWNRLLKRLFISAIAVK
jgi:hypothetical protein